MELACGPRGMHKRSTPGKCAQNETLLLSAAKALMGSQERFCPEENQGQTGRSPIFNHGNPCLKKYWKMNGKQKNLIERRGRRIAQCNELPRRIFGGREWRIRIRVHDSQYLAAANSADGQRLTLHGDHPVFFVKNRALGGLLHSWIGCRIPRPGLVVFSPLSHNGSKPL